MQQSTETDTLHSENNPPIFFVVPSPAFQNYLDPLLSGIQYHFPGVTTFGGIASTVSSLSRARLFRYSANDPQGTTTFTDGCVGIAMTGDIKVKTLIAQGTKPVGGIYRIVSGNDCTIKAIMLDQLATEEANLAAQSKMTYGDMDDVDGNNDDDNDDDDDNNRKNNNNKYSMAAAAYAKAAIPKPPLAEANFLMRTLSDDDQSSMRRAILIGLERGGSLGRTPNELARLAEGKGHRFTVFQVANIQPGTRIRFFVRESGFAKQEVQAIWMGYKKQVLEETLSRMASKDSTNPTQAFQPAMCMLLTTFDRGNKFFRGKSGYETNAVTQFIPSLPTLGGFSTNGIIGKLDDTELGGKDVMVHGSASTYVLIGSASSRPLYYGAKEAASRRDSPEPLSNKNLDTSNISTTTSSSPLPSSLGTKTSAAAAAATTLRGTAPRTANGELQLKRREVHAGRALTVSSVEWSVAENTAIPTSTLEGFLWDKETEVDRFRERVPLANLVSQCRLSLSDPNQPKPRDWVGPILRRRNEDSNLVLIPECKRQEPWLGSLHKRYDVSKLTTQFVKAGAVALSINADAILFGGSLDDITTARAAASKAAVDIVTTDLDGMEVPPILASDLIIYPYQLYKLRLAGADAVTLMAGALSDKDMLYLTKIAASLQLQCLVLCTSEVQLESLLKLSPGSIQGIILSNRDLEDFSFDRSGQQVLRLLKSDALIQYRNHHGDSQLILVEGRVGPSLEEARNVHEEEEQDEEGNGTTTVMTTTTMKKKYSEELQDAGAMGAIVSGKISNWERWMNEM
jgi:indole-3-glycerol phosphate synthase